jgi:hypothetical protein
MLGRVLGRSLARIKVFALVKGDTTCATSREAGARVREGPVEASFRQYTGHSSQRARVCLSGCVCIQGFVVAGACELLRERACVQAIGVSSASEGACAEAIILDRGLSARYGGIACHRCR